MTYERPAWLASSLMQSILPNRVRRLTLPQRERLVLHTRDGDELLIDTLDSGEKPLVLILHGLGGCSGSTYVLGMQKALHEAGFDTWAWNARGALLPNKTLKTYHGGAFEDVQDLIAQTPDRPIYAVGFSLGASMLMNTLGRDLPKPLTAAVAVSCPFEFIDSCNYLDRPRQFIFRNYLVGRLKRLARAKRIAFPHLTELPGEKELRSLKHFRAFDDRITAPFNGFKDAYDLYTKVDPNNVIGNVKTQTLLIHADDDPMFVPHARPKTPLPKSIEFELTRGGGHVGFVAGKLWAPYIWSERRVVDYFRGFGDIHAGHSGLPRYL